MDIHSILQYLRDQLSRLDAAISALEGASSAPRRGRPPKSAESSTARRGPRRMSAAARAKIAAAQRERWAKHKGQATPNKAAKTAKKASGRRGMSPAARKRLSQLMRKRWAERKKQAA